jgi:hypothetical protein
MNNNIKKKKKKKTDMGCEEIISNTYIHIRESISIIAIKKKIIIIIKKKLTNKN